MSTNWLSNSRTKQLAMAKTWMVVLTNKAGDWDVPATEVTVLGTLTTAAETALAKMQNKTIRTRVDSTACTEAFKALVAKMRYVKNNYFNSPPRTVEELAMLDLFPPSPHTDVPPAQNQVTAKMKPLGDHLIQLVTEVVGNTIADTKGSDYGYRVYWGIMPLGGATLEVAAGRGRELMSAPRNGADLPFSKFSRKKKEVFDFSGDDRGKTVYFCIRFENAKGQSGPWGPMLATVIP